MWTFSSELRPEPCLPGRTQGNPPNITDRRVKESPNRSRRGSSSLYHPHTPTTVVVMEEWCTTVSPCTEEGVVETIFCDTPTVLGPESVGSRSGTMVPPSFDSNRIEGASRGGGWRGSNTSRRRLGSPITVPTPSLSVVGGVYQSLSTMDPLVPFSAGYSSPHSLPGDLLSTTTWTPPPSLRPSSPFSFLKDPARSCQKRYIAGSCASPTFTSGRESSTKTPVVTVRSDPKQPRVDPNSLERVCRRHSESPSPRRPPKHPVDSNGTPGRKTSHTTLYKCTCHLSEDSHSRVQLSGELYVLCNEGT